MNQKIFKHYDSGDVCKVPIYVCVDEGISGLSPVHVHLTQEDLRADPLTTDEFVQMCDWKQVVLTVRDLPKLLKEVKQAARELRAEKKVKS